MTTTVLFDLDGTLLPMDQDVFVKAYFGGLARTAAPRGYDAQKLIDTIWAGTAAMVKNDGRQTNETVFWQVFHASFGPESRRDVGMFDRFYEQQFQDIRHVCGYQPRSAELLRELKDAGVRVVLATNPIFPRVATDSRIRWAGLEPTDFAYYTTYENSCHSKPNPAYYRDILQQLDIPAEACIMVGNDVEEDMIAESLGMRVFLLTDCLINKNNSDISRYPHGDMDALAAYLRMQLQQPKDANHEN